MVNSLFTSSPQVLVQKTYFLYLTSPTTAQIYNTATDAKLQRNPFTLLTAGVGTQNAFVLNTWAINATVFTNTPVFDFSAGIPYQTFTFTPSATTGYAVTITSSNAIFTAANVGGTFSGNGGITRITSVSSSTVIVVQVLQPFTDTTAIPGNLSVLTEPAWSNARGWPRVCSSFQNRAFFANTD